MTCSTWPAEALRSLPLLASLTETELTWLLPSIKRRRYEARVCILRAGDTPEGIYIIVTGHVQLVHEDDEGHALVADLFGAGELFGEMGLIEATDCPANVVAAEACEVAFIPRKSLLECLDANPPAAMALLRISLERLCRAHRQMGNLALTTVYTRVAQVLAANGHEDNGEWHVDVGSQQIAAMVGSSREMVSRVLRCMIEKQLVRRHKRKLIVIHRDVLRAPTA
jgi:CRP/FNR family transcriptional regulator, cyclic AMP receptor protein